MATTQSVKNQLQSKNNTSQQPTTVQTLKGLLSSPTLKKRFEEILDKRAPQFMTSIMNLYSSEKALQKCDPMSVISSAMVAATLDLPIDKNLGYAWIVPYGNQAQFQLGYKGYIQLALRTGQYRSINVIEVYDGQLESFNPLTEEIVINFENKQSDSIVGYAAHFELLNGFRKTIYWTRDQVEEHRKKFSKSDFGWKNDYDAMAKKTVLKSLLSKWGILSIEMQKAYINDEKEVNEVELIDDNVIDISTHQDIEEHSVELEEIREEDQ
ncbi:recombinase RecT [Tepidibacillus sp. LV47]|uniref:recombinase RecT n=1 Tax=Tepidibacillus sp. LV47 TaxID=3398228 RepID=UPI003AB09C70